MNPYLELRQMLGERTQTLTGTVLSVDAQAVKVRTAQGVIDARSIDGAFSVGDDVLIKGGIVQGRVKPAASVPIYYV